MPGSKTLKEIYIDADELDRYYEGKVPVNLWRAQHIKNAGQSIFSLTTKETKRARGRTRQADITIESRNGVEYVLVKSRPRGVSVFDRSNVFEGSHWRYIKIPAGTEIPPGLAITKDDFSRRYFATHHTIAPAYDMPLKRFIALLDQFARNVKKRLVEES